MPLPVSLVDLRMDDVIQSDHEWEAAPRRQHTRSKAVKPRHVAKKVLVCTSSTAPRREAHVARQHLQNLNLPSLGVGCLIFGIAWLSWGISVGSSTLDEIVAHDLCAAQAVRSHIAEAGKCVVDFTVTHADWIEPVPYTDDAAKEVGVYKDS